VQQQPMTLLHGSFHKPVQATEQVFSLLLTVIIHKISDAVLAMNRVIHNDASPVIWLAMLRSPSKNIAD